MRGSSALYQVGVVKSMFPHVPEASIRYDLMVSGSAEVTCDKILQQGYLPPVRGVAPYKQPPDGFPGADEAQRPAVEEPVQQSTETEPPTAPANLITRYRLEGRLADTDTSSAISTAWSDNANDRQKSLEERKAAASDVYKRQPGRRMAQRQNQQGPASAAPITPL